MSGGETFIARTIWNEAHKRRDRVIVARCGKCGREAMIADTSGAARSVSFFAKKFRDKGWRIAAHRRDDACPPCVGGLKLKPRALTPEQKRAAFCRIAGVPRAGESIPSEKPKEAVMTKPSSLSAPALVVVAEPPRQPTRDDIRKILDALNDCYLVDKGCYAKGDSDEALAKRLAVPRAWVTAERDRAFGPDASEEDGADLKLIAGLIVRADQIEAQGMALAEKAEALRMEVRRLEGRLVKRGVA